MKTIWLLQYGYDYEGQYPIAAYTSVPEKFQIMEHGYSEQAAHRLLDQLGTYSETPLETSDKVGGYGDFLALQQIRLYE